jgi:hypothetical protein
MIDELEAIKLMEEFFQCSNDDPVRPWTMTSFPEGWLASQGPFEGYVGQATYVVERDGGRILMFSSAVPPKRIREKYLSVAGRGIEVKPGKVDP